MFACMKPKQKGLKRGPKAFFRIRNKRIHKSEKSQNVDILSCLSAKRVF